MKTVTRPLTTPFPQRLWVQLALALMLGAPLAGCLAADPSTRVVTALEQVASHPGAALLPVLQPGDPIRLVPEPDHPFQPGAVAAYWGEFKLGYLPAALNGRVCATCASSVPAARISAVVGQGVELELLRPRRS